MPIRTFSDLNDSSNENGNDIPLLKENSGSSYLAVEDNASPHYSQNTINKNNSFKLILYKNGILTETNKFYPFRSISNSKESDMITSINKGEIPKEMIEEIHKKFKGNFPRDGKILFSLERKENEIFKEEKDKPNFTSQKLENNSLNGNNNNNNREQLTKKKEIEKFLEIEPNASFLLKEFNESEKEFIELKIQWKEKDRNYLENVYSSIEKILGEEKKGLQLDKELNKIVLKLRINTESTLEEIYGIVKMIFRGILKKNLYFELKGGIPPKVLKMDKEIKIKDVKLYKNFINIIAKEL